MFRLYQIIDGCPNGTRFGREYKTLDTAVRAASRVSNAVFYLRSKLPNGQEALVNVIREGKPIANS